MRKDLTARQKAVLVNAQTETPGSGKLLSNTRKGSYSCGGCGNVLFDSGHKFDSWSGWPSFYDTVTPDSISTRIDTSHGMVRSELRCAECSGHLGHVFDDAPDKPTGKRYCVNSAALCFTDENGSQTDG